MTRASATTDYAALADVLEREVQARLADPARRDTVAATFGDFGADDRLGRAEGRYLDLMLPHVAASLGINDLPEGRGERLAALSGVTTASADDYVAVDSMVDAVTGAIGRTQRLLQAQPVRALAKTMRHAADDADEGVAETGTRYS
jgi:hypothetical protein